jgi:hypothetical protein
VAFCLDFLKPGFVISAALSLLGCRSPAHANSAGFRSLAEPWADTGTSTGRLMLAVLGGLGDVERDLIRTRTAEGRSRAKAQGKHMGTAIFPTVFTSMAGR